MPKRTCGLCTAEQFEVGYGARRKVQGVWDEVCDKCAAPHTKREVQKIIDIVEGLKRAHPDVDWSQFLDKAYRSERRLKAWEARFETEPDRVKGFLRLCEDDSRWISRTSRRHLIDEYLRRAMVTMDQAGEVKIQIDTADPKVVRGLQRRQRSLDTIRERIMRGIKLIQENLEMLDTRGLLQGPASWNLLKVTVDQAVQVYLRSQDYQLGKEKSDEHKIAQAARLATQGLGGGEAEATGGGNAVTETPSTEAAADEAPVPEPATTPAEPAEAPEVVEEPPTETISGLPDIERIIKVRRTKPARKKEEGRARELLGRCGGRLWPTVVDEDTPLSAEDLKRRLEEGAANGGLKVSSRGRKKEEVTA